MKILVFASSDSVNITIVNIIKSAQNRGHYYRSLSFSG